MKETAARLAIGSLVAAVFIMLSVFLLQLPAPKGLALRLSEVVAIGVVLTLAQDRILRG